MSESLQNLKKQITMNEGKKKAKGGSKKSKLSSYIPSFVKETAGSLSKKQMLDVTLFGIGIICIYKYGGNISEKVDELMPNE